MKNVKFYNDCNNTFLHFILEYCNVLDKNFVIIACTIKLTLNNNRRKSITIDNIKVFE